MNSIFDLFRRIEARESLPDAAPVTWIIAGLGNPGYEYEKTRHNAGFRALDRIAQKAGIRINRSRSKCLYGRGVWKGKGVVLMKPQTYMNLSGDAVQPMADFFKVPADRILVLSDDVSLDVGRIRVRRKGSAGGHNGLKSVIARLGSDAFPRVKIGVGSKPSPETDLASWVLGSIPEDLSAEHEKSLEDAVGAAALIISGSIEEAMNRYNS